MHRFFRFLLPVLAVAVFSGCAGKSEESLEDLESRARDEQLFDLRISSLEDRVTLLETGFGQMRDPAPKGSSKASREKAARVAAPKKGSSERLAASPVILKTISLDDMRSSEPSPSTADPAQSGSPAPIPESGAPAGNGAESSPAASSAPGLTVLAAEPAKPSPPVQARPQPRIDKTGSQAYDAAMALYTKGEYDKSREAFADFLAGSPNSPLAPNALYWQGECLYSLRKYDNAIIFFKDVAARYPKHAKAAAALLKAGYSYERLKDMENARFYWQILVDDFPKSAPAALARQRL